MTIRYPRMYDSQDFYTARKAINDMFSDRSAPAGKTRELLEELRDEIDMLIDTLPKGEPL